jgi:hypothetical protein
LTLTVSGTVEIAQLELGASRTSYQDVLDANGLNVTESGQADVYYLALDGAGDELASSSGTQLVGPWEFWAKINMLAGAGIGEAVFTKSLPNSAATVDGSEGIYQRTDVVRRIWAASRVGSGSSSIASADNAFNYNSPITAKAIGTTGPDNLTATTPLASGTASPTWTGTPTPSTAYRIGTANAAARFNFYGGVAIDRNLTAGEATNLDTWMDALLNP